MIIIISCTKIILELFLTLLCGINVSMLNILKDKNKSFNFKVIFVLWFVFKMSKSWHIFHFLCAQSVFFKYLSSYTDVFCYEHVDSLAHILAGYVFFCWRRPFWVHFAGCAFYLHCLLWAVNIPRIYCPDR